MLRILLSATVMAIGLQSSSADAQPVGALNSPQLPCNAFVRHANGMWSPTREMTITNPPGMSAAIGPGAAFGRGAFIAGLPLAQILDAQCINISPNVD
jgi:hypothetical protein